MRSRSLKIQRRIVVVRTGQTDCEPAVSSAPNGVTLAGVSTSKGAVQNPFRPRCRPSTGCPRHHHVGCQDHK